MSALLLIIACAVINRLRGWGPTDKYDNANPPARPPLRLVIAKHLTGKNVVTPLYLGLAVWIYSSSIELAAVFFAAYQVWALKGWGDYWDGSSKPNNEVSFIDNLVEKFLAPGLLNDLVSMSLRGFIFSAIILWPYAIYTASAGMFVVSSLMLWQGPIYHALRIASNDKGWHPIAEVMTGALWALVIMGVTWLS
jgi:hypothetical protein